MLAKSILFGAMAWPVLAAAQPTIVVGGDAPFTTAELDRALQLRGPVAREVRVERRGDALVVRVGQAAQTVTIAPGDPRDAARMIAMVIVALDGAPAPVADVADREVPQVLQPVAAAGAPAQAPFHRFAFRASLGKGRDDGGTETHPITGALAYSLAPHTRLAASVSLMKATTARPQDLFVPLRLGLEGRAGATGLEMGAFVAAQSDCFGRTSAVYGGYATGRVYLPLAPRYQLILEANGYWAVDQNFGCSNDPWPLNQAEPSPYVPGMIYGTYHGKAYGGALGVGLEWEL